MGRLDLQRLRRDRDLCVILPIVLVAWVGSGLSPDEHLRRLVRVRAYVLAMCVRMLLLVNFSAVLAVMGKYLIELRDYPREVAGWVLAPAALDDGGLDLPDDRLPPPRVAARLAAGGRGGDARAASGGSRSIDNFTPKEHIAAILACWGLFLGLFPPVFLTDEVEALEPKDALYAGALAVVCLVTPLLVVPIATSTAISAWTDRALDSQRLNLREERVAVREAQARVADDYRQRGVAGPEQAALTGTALGGVRQDRERGPRVSRTA